jgi:hypothetical protein
MVLLGLTSILNFAVSIIINKITLPPNSPTVSSAVLTASIEFLMLCGLTSAVLYGLAKTARIAQTLTALMGSGVIIGTAVLLALALTPQLPEALRLAIFLWNLAVMAHILRHALNIHFAIAFCVAVGYALVLVELIMLVARLLQPAAT